MTGLSPTAVHLPTRDGRPGTGPFSYELGTKVQVSSPTQLTAIRFYKDSLETGSHTGNVWSSNGSLLAQTTFHWRERIGLAGSGALHAAEPAARTDVHRLRQQQRVLR